MLARVMLIGTLLGALVEPQLEEKALMKLKFKEQDQESFTAMDASRDGSAWMLAYSTQDKKGNPRHFMVVNGKKQGPFAEPVDVFEFEYGDGSSWGYDDFKGGTYHVVVNGKKVLSAKEDSVKLGWGFHGSSWAVLLSKGEKTQAVINGKKWGPYAHVGRTDGGAIIEHISFSENGKSWGFWTGTEEKGFVILNGKKLGPYSRPGNPVFSANGSSWGFGIAENKLVINGKAYEAPFSVLSPTVSKPGAKTAFMSTAPFSFSADGKRWGFVTGGKGVYGVTNEEGKSVGPFASPFAPIFSESGEWGFLAGDGGNWVVGDGETTHTFDGGKALPSSSTPPHDFMIKGSSWTFKVDASASSHYVFVKDQLYGPYPENPTDVAFSTDGSSWGFAAMTSYAGGYQAVIDGKTYGACKSVGQAPAFSDDGKTWAFSCYRSDGTTTVFVNGQEHGPYKFKMPVDGPGVSPDGRFWWIFANCYSGDGIESLVINDQAIDLCDITSPVKISKEGIPVFYQVCFDGDKGYYEVTKVTVGAKKP